MLPSLTSRDIEAGMRSFIEREFPIATPGFRSGDQSMVETFLSRKENFIKGPWLEIKRPFRKAAADMKALLPELAGHWGVAADWVPYQHQLRAFERLRHPAGRSAIVATGTGSGKTECFLLPIIDAVLQMRAAGAVKGIKAIVIYPMNALATDQSRRFADLCSKVVKAGGPGLTVGLYTGAPGTVSRMMEATVCITDRDQLLKYPPDVLLTNYKMLDYLLLRGKDQALWKGTTKETLRFLVVDELHTFDGAQGTDLACLVRRLRDRLDLGDDLACVGTSATLGGGDRMAALQEYAASVFGADFSDADSIITEDRLTQDEYLASFGESKWVGGWPKLYELRPLKELGPSAPVERFIESSSRLWFNEERITLRAGDAAAWETAALKLSGLLPHHEAFRRLISAEESLIHLETLAEHWRRIVPELKGFTLEDVMLLLRSLTALISMARTKSEATGRIEPFLTVRVQLWLKELSNMLATVEPQPRLLPMADVGESTPLALPVLTCRDCNATAWGATELAGEVGVNPTNFYRAWFRRDPDVRLLYPVVRKEFAKIRGRYQSELRRFCPVTKRFAWAGTGAGEDEVYSTKCTLCGGEHAPIVVRVPDMVTEGRNERGRYARLQPDCPWCGSVNSLRIIGARSVTLSSAMTGHLNSTDANDDHKLISFSDSVQDAAHRAGFMEARSSSYAMRQAVAGLIRDPDGGSGNFYDFLSRISDYWLERVGGLAALRSSENAHLREKADDIARARFTATFIPSSMLWRRPWIDFMERVAEYRSSPHEKDAAGGKDESTFAVVPAAFEKDGATLTRWGRLWQNVSVRLRWEAFAEMTLRAHSGRTIELTGVGAVVPGRGIVEDAAAALLPQLSEHVGGLRDVEPGRVERFIEGFLIHQKMRGCFDVRLDEAHHKYDDFARFVETGEDYFFNTSLTLPTYGGSLRAPAPLVERRGKRRISKFFDAVLPESGRGETWYTLWLSRVFDNDLEVLAAAEEIYHALLGVLVEQGVAAAVPMTQGGVAYLLRPTGWRIERQLDRAVCPQCGRWHVVDRARSGLWRRMPCLSPGCLSSGHDVRPMEGDDAVYRGMPGRIMAREHTSNLDHIERGQIERSFIEGVEPWEVNLLCATPTLEMGIDIGDLSSVMLASMPPQPANYVQRIGRAGRRDGNALAMTVCDAGPHAQYFWQDPERMLSGAVEPPGVFLHAMAVMERQLFAFAVTRWIVKVENAELPRQIKEVLNLDPQKGHPKENFPYGLLDYVEENADMLVAEFAQLFDEKREGAAAPLLRPEEKARLLAFLNGTATETPSVRARLLGKIKSLRGELEGSRRKLESCTKAIRQLKKQPQDEKVKADIEELQANKKSLDLLIKREFLEKDTLNVLTDEGVLPNYAFPEEGITIDGVVMKVRDRQSRALEASGDGGSPNQGAYKRFTFQRSASTGLFETAPGNSFYVNEFILHIDQVDLEDEAVEEWRFCPTCMHCEVERPGDSGAACPRCGDPAWQEESQKRPVLQLKNVYAWADLRRDRIRDDREDRRTVEQSRAKLVDIDPRVERRSFVMDRSEGFGFEYIPSVTLRDFNFGQRGSNAAEMLDVASSHLTAPGFRVCRHCGRLAKEVRVNERGEEYTVGREQHDVSCPAHADPTKEEWIDGLVLFREFRSEALRVRMPQGLLTERWSPEMVAASLTAALRLGLRRYYHGSVSHLQFTQMEEPVENGSRRQKYLVVYDSVPGGTGYLKELLEDPEKLLGVFESALEAMRTCPCGADEEADGCYRCLYQYRDAGQRRDVSKRCAVELIEMLLAERGSLRPGRIDVVKGGDNTESELERQFLVALRNAGDYFKMKRVAEGGGLYHYILTTRTNRIWRLDLQEDFRGEHPSRPDFTIRPYREEERRPELTMAVFTDGWTYHAPIVAEDLAKRQSILNQGMRVWSLMWEDVEPMTKSPEDPEAQKRCVGTPFDPALLGRIEPFYEQMSAWQRKVRGAELPKLSGMRSKWLTEGSMTRLFEWLLDPEAVERAGRAEALLATLVLKARPKAMPEGAAFFETSGLSTMGASWAAAEGEGFWKSLHTMTGSGALAALFAVDAAAVKAAFEASPAKAEAEVMRRFWNYVNMLQFADGLVLLPAGAADGAFLKRCAAASPWERAIERTAEAAARPAAPAPAAQTEANGAAGGAPAEAAALEAQWSEAKEMIPETLHPLAERLAAAGVSVNPDDVGADLADPDLEEVAACAELYWPERKTAVILDDAAPAGWEMRVVAGVRCWNGALDPDALAAKLIDALGRTEKN